MAGLGGSVSVSGEVNQQPRYVTGGILLDAPDLTSTMAQPGGELHVRAIVMHELGHLVGLAHVDDPEQLMYPEARREVADFTSGDLAGLAVLGAGPCVPEL